MRSDHIGSAVSAPSHCPTYADLLSLRSTQIIRILFPVCVWFIVGILQGSLGGGWEELLVLMCLGFFVFVFLRLLATCFLSPISSRWCFRLDVRPNGSSSHCPSPRDNQIAGAVSHFRLRLLKRTRTLKRTWGNWAVTSGAPPSARQVGNFPVSFQL